MLILVALLAGDEARGFEKPVFPLKAMVYILPHRKCSDYWQRKYGDRIYYYVYGNLLKDRSAIEEDFRIISSIYRMVIIVVPADDTENYFRNIRVINQVALESDLKVIYAIFPKEKYGREDTYLEPGSPMYNLVLKDMDYFSSLRSSFRVAVWYGWRYRNNGGDITAFYYSLPLRLRRWYAVWLDEGYTGAGWEAIRSGLPQDVLIITELYDRDLIDKYCGLFPRQMVVTGYSGASSLREWKNGMERLLSGCKTNMVGVWIFYDKNDGSGENCSALINGALTDFYWNPVIPFLFKRNF